MRKLSVFVASLLLSAFLGDAQRSSISGFRAFADAGYSIGIGDYKFNRPEISAALGYQINPFIFVGAGAGFHFMPEYETGNSVISLDERDSTVDIPIYGNIRFNFTKSTFSPFVDFRGGKFVTNDGDLYINISGGIRYTLPSMHAIYLAVGYTREDLVFQTFASFISSSSMSYYRKPSEGATEALTFKVGFEF